MKREPGTWGYNWATLFLRHINTELACSKNIVVNSKEVNTRRNLAESSKDYGSNMAALATMMMMDFGFSRR
jgi:hypothetical protein